MMLTRASHWLVAVLLVDAVVVWALVELAGPGNAWGGAGGGVLGPLVFTWWQTYRTPAMRREQVVIADAVIRHRDPGPEFRAAVDARARQLLAGPRSNQWLPSVLLLALALACVLVGLHRGGPAVALPAVPLAVFAVVVPVVIRRRLHAAAWWLEVPPFDRAAQP